MSLYHETAAALVAAISDDTSIKSHVFGQKSLRSPPAQVYALAVESCKWSRVLKEVIESSQLLHHERKLTPLLALLLVHDLLLAKNGIALPASHGLRASVERHKARLSSELTRARVRRKVASVDALRAEINGSGADLAGGGHPRWVRINTLKTSMDAELQTTFSGFSRTESIREVCLSNTSSRKKLIYVDQTVPNLVAIPPGSAEIMKTEAYRSGKIILQDKASCFPAYMLDPLLEDGDVIDACAAPGNKTTHLGAIIQSRHHGSDPLPPQRIHAFEKDEVRAKTLEKMVKIAGSDGFTVLHKGQDFLKTDPDDRMYQNVGALLLDPSCSGSGIVGREGFEAPQLVLPRLTHRAGADADAGKSELAATSKGNTNRKKRKRAGDEDETGTRTKAEGKENWREALLTDAAWRESARASTSRQPHRTTPSDSKSDLEEHETQGAVGAARLTSLSGFQCKIIEHAFRFPAARKITYSTCSIHEEEDEQVVLRVLRSNVARERGWRLLRREEQVRGIKEYPVRGRTVPRDEDGSAADADVAAGCVRSYLDGDHGMMGFFVAMFVRDDVDAEATPEATPEASSVARWPRQHQHQHLPVIKQSSRSHDGHDVLSVGTEAAQGGKEAPEESDWEGFDD